MCSRQPRARSFLVVVAPSVSNDHLWRDMNSTGVQTFVGLVQRQAGTGTDILNPFAASSVVRKDYSASATICTRPAASRAVLLSKLPLDQAIRVLRAIPFRNFANGVDAMHAAIGSRTPRFEALFRNLEPTDLVTSTYGTGLNTCLFLYVQSTPGGNEWVDATLAPKSLAVADESMWWQVHGLANFVQNYYLEGTHMSVAIVNADAPERHDCQFHGDDSLQDHVDVVDGI
ncbi:hypothetical protein As57867_007306, partial [Aphanomyces stellatus]